jgi:hypothetical protein
MSEFINTDEPEHVLDHLNTIVLLDHDLHLHDPDLFGECSPAIITPVSVDGKVVQSLIDKLIKVQSKMKAMMQISETHESDTLKFVDNAKKTANIFRSHKRAVITSTTMLRSIQISTVSFCLLCLVTRKVCLTTWVQMIKLHPPLGLRKQGFLKWKTL